MTKKSHRSIKFIIAFILTVILSVFTSPVFCPAGAIGSVVVATTATVAGTEAATDIAGISEPAGTAVASGTVIAANTEGTAEASSTSTMGSTVKKTDLVLVTDYSEDFVIDMKYATCDNFVKKAMYPSPTCVLTKGTLDKLIKANNIVGKQGYAIKIWDAYRPLSVQKIMWDATPNKNYVANPYRSGSKHNKGAAVDITLVDKNGKELNMPTGFDNFTARASPNYKGMSAEQRKNLNILSKAMTTAGFKQLSTEWWHFDDTEYAAYKIQDVPLSKFDKTDYTLSNTQISGMKFIKSSQTSQLILVTSQISNTSNVIVSTYEKKDGAWVNIHRNIPGYIGVYGFTANKTEGDKKTPVGAFNIGTEPAFCPL